MVMEYDSYRSGLAWQTEIWNRMSDVYVRELDRRFVPVIEQVIASAGLSPGERALDIGAGTGPVALRAATLVAPGGSVTGIDISPEMLALARRRAEELGLDNISFREGRAEAIPAADAAFDVALASLSLMADAGIDARVETATIGFSFDDFASVWEALAGVTVAQLAAEQRQEAQAAVMAAMWPHGDGPRHFRNATHFITGRRR
jgi:SAM-dependent methyltransferase